MKDELRDCLYRCSRQLNKMKGIFFIKSADFRYAYVSEELVSCAGLLSRDEIIGKLDSELPWRDVSGIYSYFDRYTVSYGKAFSITPHYNRSSQKYNLISSEKYAIYNKANIAIGIFGWVSLINDRVCVQSQLNEYLSVPIRRTHYIDLKCSELALSKRESECLFYLMRGETTKSISLKLGVESRTINLYLENVKNKFSTFDRQGLINHAWASQFKYFIPATPSTSDFEKYVDRVPCHSTHKRSSTAAVCGGCGESNIVMEYLF